MDDVAKMLQRRRAWLLLQGLELLVNDRQLATSRPDQHAVIVELLDLARVLLDGLER